MPRPVVFLDDGGVMNDNQRRAVQWQRLVGEFFTPILGGTPQAWAEANRVVITSLLAPEVWQARLRDAPDYGSFERAYLLDWLGAMCEAVGVPRPPEDESVDLARRAGSWIIQRVDAAFPGAVQAIRLLDAWGYQLHTASGEPSVDLAAYLERMGVRACFGRLYGPDLIDTFKAGPDYYARLLHDAGVDPADALVVDDSALALRWAAEVGARTVLVGNRASPEAGASWCIGRLADLPGIITHIDDAGADRAAGAIPSAHLADSMRTPPARAGCEMDGARQVEVDHGGGYDPEPGSPCRGGS